MLNEHNTALAGRIWNILDIRCEGLIVFSRIRRTIFAIFPRKIWAVLRRFYSEFKQIPKLIAMKILQDCQRFLSYGGVGTNQYVNISGIHIPRTLIRAILAFVLLLGSCLQLINIINTFAVGLHAMLLPVHCLLHNVVKSAVYSALLWKINEIHRLIDYMAMVVRQRKFSVHSNVFLVFSGKK